MVTFVEHEPLPKAGDYDEILFRFTVLDPTRAGSPEETTLTSHVTVSVTISRTLQATWSLQSSDLLKVLFEYAKRHLIQTASKGVPLADMRVDLNTSTAPTSCPYDPSRIAMEWGGFFDVEIKRDLGFRTG